MLRSLARIKSTKLYTTGSGGLEGLTDLLHPEMIFEDNDSRSE